MVNIVTKRKSKSAIFFGKLKEYIVQIPKEHKGFMKQTFMLAKEDLLKTYKGAVIGPLWALVKPLFQLFVYWFAFSILRGDSNDHTEMGVEYFLFIMAGFVPWFFMSDCIGRGSRAIADNRHAAMAYLRIVNKRFRLLFWCCIRSFILMLRVLK